MKGGEAQLILNNKGILVLKNIYERNKKSGKNI